MADIYGFGVPDSALIMLAKLMLTRARLKGMQVTSRAQAISIIKGMRPAPKRTQPLTIQSAIGKVSVACEASFCSSCGKPLPTGSLCRTVWTLHTGEHINCEGRKS